MTFRFMRMILFFDLPVETSSNRKEYRHFVSKLKKTGFIMLQKSVYIKLSINITNVEKTIKLVKNFKPKEGNVAILTITEKQFAEIEYIIGEFDTNVINSEDRMIEI